MLPIFVQYVNFEHNILIFFSLFQCGPQDLNLCLMRPASDFEFETPVLELGIYLTISEIILFPIRAFIIGKTS